MGGIYAGGGRRQAELCTPAYTNGDRARYRPRKDALPQPFEGASVVKARWTPPADVLDRVSWRCIGPFRAGRVVAVAGHPTERNVFYFGSTGGGVWRTDDAGIYWTNVSDGFFKRASVGAIALAPSDPKVIYVGMGES